MGLLRSHEMYRVAAMEPGLRYRMRTKRLMRKGFAAAPRHRGYGPGLMLIGRVLAGLLIIAAAGCGSSYVDSRAEEEIVAERALQAALEGERAGFVKLVAPSFLEQLRAEMPDTDDEVLGGVIIAGFLERIPFAGIIEASYSIFEYPDGIVVYVSGRFIADDGAEVVIGEADAVRIPLVFEDGRFCIDLLDL
jgi:hypothetical protein